MGGISSATATRFWPIPCGPVRQFGCLSCPKDFLRRKAAGPEFLRLTPCVYAGRVIGGDCNYRVLVALLLPAVQSGARGLAVTQRLEPSQAAGASIHNLHDTFGYMPQFGYAWPVRQHHPAAMLAVLGDAAYHRTSCCTTVCERDKPPAPIYSVQRRPLNARKAVQMPV